jgi:hypothetical protein
LLAGCAFGPRAPFNPPAPPEGAAEVFFYRPSEMTGRLIKPTITAGGAVLGKLANDSYAAVRLPAGPVTLRASWPGLPGQAREGSQNLILEPGHNYFVRIRYKTDKAREMTPAVKGIGSLSFEDRTGLEAVAEDVAVPQMAGMAAADWPPAAAAK